MLIEFSVGNYKSFKDRVTFSMVAAKLKAKEKTLDENNTFRIDDDLVLLKSAGIYGANASGKSNFVSAIKLMQSELSGRWFQDPKGAEEFKLSDDTVGKPSYFEAVFLVDGMRYRYGFEVSSHEVISEWLFCTPSTKEARLFVRQRGVFRISNKFKEARRLEAKTRKDKLFLSVVSEFNGRIASVVSLWFQHLLIVAGLSDQTLRDYTVKLFDHPVARDAMIQLIKRFDLDIEAVEIGPGPLAKLASIIEPLEGIFVDTPTINTVHLVRRSKRAKPRKVMFDMDHNESEGTRKLFSLAGPIVASLQDGIPLIVDEFDSRLHPLVSRSIVTMYNSRETNPHNAQLIFTTHDTNLLSNKIFRRDQIWFTEKNRDGASDLYSLAEFKPPSQGRVRNDASFEKDYIRGRYGAVPFIGEVSGVGENDA